MYNFQLHYEPGTSIPVADALSTAPLNCNNDDDHEIINNLTYNPVKEKQMNEMKEASLSKDDDEMNMLMQMIATGWPEHNDNVPLQIRHYFTYYDELTAQDGIVLQGRRLVVPKSLRSKMKAKYLAGHLGINSTLRHVQDLLYWPGMSTDVRNYVEICAVCASTPVKQPPEPVISRDVPERSWQRIGSDIMSFEGRTYVIITDCHSSFCEINKLTDMSADTVIRKLKKNFARHGIPEEQI